MNLRLLTVPYDSGHYDTRMGAGPGHLLRIGLAERLRARGHRVEVTEVRADPDAFPVEVGTAFDLQRRLAVAVRGAVAAGELPVVLAGNCNTAVGTVAGLGAGAAEVVWLDAHGDFNTPETSIGGFLDGMSISMLVGQCWRQLTAGVPGFEPRPESAVYLVGARDLDPLEAERLTASAVRLFPPAEAVAGLRAALEAGGDRTRGVYLHLDLDVLDPAEAVINCFAAAGGLGRSEVEEIVRLIGERRRIAAIAVTALDPAADAEGRGGEAACGLIEAAVETAARSRDV
jgi:arginase